MHYVIREMRKEEYNLLADFLYEAIFVPKGQEPPNKDIIKLPELWLCIDNFGKEKDDFALVAEIGNKVVGAAWVRIMDDYGHIDDETPSLLISLYKEYRGKGVGRALMKKLLMSLKAKGYKRISLSVQKDNYAVKLYRFLNFKIIYQTEKEYLMVYSFN